MVLGVVGILSDEVVDLIDDAFEFVDCCDIEDIDLGNFIITRLRGNFWYSKFHSVQVGAVFPLGNNYREIGKAEED